MSLTIWKLRTLLLAAATVASISLPAPAAADPRVYFRNQSPRTARVTAYSQNGKFRGTRVFPPGGAGRLHNGEGKMVLRINGRSYRVRDLGYKAKDAWIINWRGGYAPRPIYGRKAYVGKPYAGKPYVHKRYYKNRD